jgi:NADH-quinone oxidoreductase subunit J
MLLLAQAAGGVGAGADTPEIVLFWVFAVLALGSAVAVITLRNIVHAALMLVLNFFAIAGLYLNLESTFLSIIQVLVYAGAIMVLFLFVIMLLGVDRDDLLAGTRRTTGLAVGGIALLGAALLVGIVGPYTSQASICGAGGTSTSTAVACIGLEEANAAEETGSVGFLGRQMFTRYTFPFELSALLLTVATIGATLLGRRNDPPPDDDVLPAGASDEPPTDDAAIVLDTEDGVATPDQQVDASVASVDDATATGGRARQNAPLPGVVDTSPGSRGSAATPDDDHDREG